MSVCFTHKSVSPGAPPQGKPPVPNKRPPWAAGGPSFPTLGGQWALNQAGGPSALLPCKHEVGASLDIGFEARGVGFCLGMGHRWAPIEGNLPRAWVFGYRPPSPTLVTLSLRLLPCVFFRPHSGVHFNSIYFPDRCTARLPRLFHFMVVCCTCAIVPQVPVEVEKIIEVERVVEKIVYVWFPLVASILLRRVFIVLPMKCRGPW